MSVSLSSSIGVTVLTPLILYKVHSVEYFVNNFRCVFVVRVVSEIFMYSFDEVIGFAELLEVNILNF